jgi:hypothetical protein
MNAELAELPDLGEFDPTKDHTLDGDMNAHRWKHDDKLTIRFRRAPILNPHKSAEAKRAIFDEKDFITIWTPGSQLTVVDAPVDSGFYLQRFRAKYEAWKKGVEEAASGTPLEHFPFLFSKIGLTAELKAAHIHTVEQLANLPDGNIQKLMGGYELRKQAQEWLDTSSAKAMDAEKEAMAKRLADLEEQLKALTAMGLTKVEAPKAVVKEK